MFLLTKNRTGITPCVASYMLLSALDKLLNAGQDTQADIAYTYKQRGKSFFDFASR